MAIFDNQTNRNDICTIYPSRLGIPQHFLERADENEAFVVAAFYHVDEMPMPVIACKVLTPPPGEPPMDDIIHLPSHIYDDGDLEHPFYRAESCPDAGLGPPLGTLLDADGGQIDGGN